MLLFLGRSECEKSYQGTLLVNCSRAVLRDLLSGRQVCGFGGFASVFLLCLVVILKMMM